MNWPLHLIVPTERQIFSPIADRLVVLSDQIQMVAARYGIDAFDLRLRLGLHLPRLWEEGVFGIERFEQSEAVRLAEAMASVRRDLAGLCQQPSNRLLPTRLQFARLNLEQVSQLAVPILSHLHYLNSFRSSSEHFGLFDESRLVALATLSPFDLPHILGAIKTSAPNSLEPSQVRVLSRVYVFRWAPRNAISRLLGLLRAFLRAHAPKVELLVTYVNPNLGFSGASYRASGCRIVVREETVGMAYLDCNYVTHRRLVELTGQARREDQLRVLKGRLIISRFPMQPLDVYGYAVKTSRLLPRIHDVPLVEDQLCSS